MAKFFNTPHSEYQALRLTQLMEEQGYTGVFANRAGQLMVNIDGHMALIALNELGQPYMVDKADLIRPVNNNPIEIR